MGAQRIAALILSAIFSLSVLAGEASAQKKKKKGGKKAAAVATDPYADKESEPAEEESNETAEEDAEADTAEEDEPKTINERLSEEETGGLRRSGRMEFDERLVKGQAAKSGAVYLFKRIPRHLPGLVPMRRSYRARIVEPILGAVPLKPAVYSTDLSKEEIKARTAAEAEEAAAEVQSVPVPTPAEDSEENTAADDSAAEKASAEKNGNGKKHKKRSRRSDGGGKK